MHVENVYIYFVPTCEIILGGFNARQCHNVDVAHGNSRLLENQHKGMTALKVKDARSGALGLMYRYMQYIHVLMAFWVHR